MYREKVNVNEPSLFGLVVTYIAANSEEWKSKPGQDAIWTEMNEHSKRGTWLLDDVVELSDLFAETRRTHEEIVLGGVHPILGAKGSGRGLEEFRCRVVFTAPRARSSSGLDVHLLSDEVSNSPITFQGSRTLRAWAALKGFIISSRDAESADLQSKLRREGSDDPLTSIALPRQVWPEK